jgi:hypothetical protein
MGESDASGEERNKNWDQVKSGIIWHGTGVSNFSFIRQVCFDTC